MTTSASQTTGSDRIGLGTVVHIAGLFLGVVGAAVVYVLSEDGFEKTNARNAVNWQILITFLATVPVVTSFIIGLMPAFGLAAFLGAINVVFCVWASIKSTEGVAWEYPMSPHIV